MASSSQGLRIGIQLLLGILILALAYWLYVSVTGPWQQVEQQREVRDRTRARMLQVSEGLRAFDRQNGRFPGSLDSLLVWMTTDSLGRSIPTDDLPPDSLLVSPRTGKGWLYTVNDTGRVAIYLLKDPDSEDHIGSEMPDVTRLNAASWQ